jgi:hypothetical protein
MGDEQTQLCESDMAMPQPGARQRVMSGVSQAVQTPARRRRLAAGLVAVLTVAAILAARPSTGCVHYNRLALGKIDDSRLRDLLQPELKPDRRRQLLGQETSPQTRKSFDDRGV